MDWIWWTFGYKTNAQLKIEIEKAILIQRVYRKHKLRNDSAFLIQRKYINYVKRKNSIRLIQKIWKKYIIKIEDKLNYLYWQNQRKKIKYGKS